jgi:AhpC/TSA family
MWCRAAWLGTIVAIGPLVGPAFARTTQVGEVVPKFECKDIRYVRRTLSDLGAHKGFALVFLNSDCPIARRFLPTLRELDACYGSKGIQVVGVFCPKIEAIAHFDNSRFNVYNPDPNRTVPYGDQTFDEMFNAFVFWTNDDENLNLKIDPKTGHVVKEPVEAAKN